jgi:hypothetical protein
MDMRSVESRYLNQLAHEYPSPETYGDDPCEPFLPQGFQDLGREIARRIETLTSLYNAFKKGLISFDGKTYIEPANPRFHFEKVDASEAYRITNIHNGEFATTLRVSDTETDTSADFITTVFADRTQPNLGAVQTKVVPHYTGKLYYRAGLESGQTTASTNTWPSQPRVNSNLSRPAVPAAITKTRPWS